MHSHFRPQNEYPLKKNERNFLQKFKKKGPTLFSYKFLKRPY